MYVHDDSTVKINPLIFGPLRADFDGVCVHLVEQSYFPRNYDYQSITWNAFISEACKQYFCFPGCVLLFDANARSGEG